MDLPYLPANQPSYDALPAAVPSLWTAFEERLLPVAGSDAPVEERVDRLLALGDELWKDAREHVGERITFELGGTWHTIVDDLVGATVEAALPELVQEPGAADRLRALAERLRRARPDSFTLNSAVLDVRAELGTLHGT